MWELLGTSQQPPAARAQASQSHARELSCYPDLSLWSLSLVSLSLGQAEWTSDPKSFCPSLESLLIYLRKLACSSSLSLSEHLISIYDLSLSLADMPILFHLLIDLVRAFVSCAMHTLPAASV
jgi:hypothetical protein